MEAWYKVILNVADEYLQELRAAQIPAGTVARVMIRMGREGDMPFTLANVKVGVMHKGVLFEYTSWPAVTICPGSAGDDPARKKIDAEAEAMRQRLKEHGFDVRGGMIA